MKPDHIERLISSVAGEGLALMFKRYSMQVDGDDTERLVYALEMLEKIFGLPTLVPILKFVGKQIETPSYAELNGDKLAVECPFKDFLLNKKPLESSLCYLCWGGLYKHGNVYFSEQKEDRCHFVVLQSV
ncbi:MAG: hypothetical protein D6699_07970 [Aquificota bacterium]|nr:MAG: hypothetical protein D6699_07970 [Aquificota bacterium]